MITVLAEKPAVARDIAKILGATIKNDGYFSGNGYAITWAFGHLIGLAMPEAYGIEGFKKENLPFLPEKFKLTPRQVKGAKGYHADPGVVKQLGIIETLFSKSESIVSATDSGREGCLIFRYIYYYLGCKKPVKRLWISSLTDKSIKEGFKNLKDGSEYDFLYLAAKARSEADYMVGLNSTQSLTIAAKQGILSLGRVQTPTLAMICSRYLENKKFIPEKYWQLKLNTQKNGIPFSALSNEKYKSNAECLQAQNLVNSGIAWIKSVERKEVAQDAPLLFDLTALQKEANTKYGFSADKTLSIAQAIYEKKRISYPRTGSKYISEDVFEEVDNLIALLSNYPTFSIYANKIKGSSLNRRSVDDSKVTDHHALLITEEIGTDLSGDEKIIYEMIAGRMLEAFSPKCIKDATSVVIDCSGIHFSVKGSVIKTAGWREVFAEKEKTEENEEGQLPNLVQDENLSIDKTECLEKQTKPKPLHTESSLLSAMETAGKDLEDSELKTAMKETGIGTPATRASIIETLFSRQYISREKKNLIPTEKGLAVYSIVKDMKIANVEMTGHWENELAKIERGEGDYHAFKKSIQEYTISIINELMSESVSIPSEGGIMCPKCKKSDVIILQKVAKCKDEKCGLTVFRSLCEKNLTETQIKDLLTKGKTGLIKGLKSKVGKLFDASLHFDSDFKTVLKFPENKHKGK